MICVHFGLGKAVVIDRLEINWPSGAHEVQTRLASESNADTSRAHGTLIAEIVPGAWKRLTWRTCLQSGFQLQVLAG